MINMKTIKRLLAVLLTAVVCTQVAAQGFRNESFPEGSYSPVTNVNRAGCPRVLSDRSVMFRVNAPQAQQVQSFYGCGRWSSAIEVKEDGCEDFEVQDVPRGEVRTVYYFSKVDESWRPLLVYTPAGYREGAQDYPVVYIQHGGGEDHRGWMEQGRTAQIMDNLIAQGKAVPMIVVSSNSNVRSRNGGFGGGYSWQGMQAFRSELIENVIPFVEKTYRVKKDRKSRAMCGLSMGGGQSFYIGLRDPEVFANVGVFSTGMFGGIQGASNFDLEKEVPGILTDTRTFNSQFDVFFMTTTRATS